MSFGGSVSAMISSLNRNRRDRKSIYDTRSPVVKASNNLSSLIANNASEEELNLLRIKLEANRTRLKKKKLTFLIISTMVISFLFYFIMTAHFNF